MVKKHRIYEINGRKYTFKDVYIKNGVTLGYCSVRKRWAALYPNYIHFDDEFPIAARLIDEYTVGKL